MSSESIKQFREKYHQQNISAHYSGWFHFSLTVSLSIIFMITSFSMLENVSYLEWLTIPVTFLYTNFSEYMGHKGPMHNKRKYLEKVFHRHTALHHVFFTHETMSFDQSKDFHAVLFPPILVVFFLGVFALPVGVLLLWLISSNVAYLFVFTIVSYFLNYELLHFSYHLKQDSCVGRLPFMKRLRKHHTDHHNQKLMSHYNFNISYPIFDWLFGTAYKEK